MSYVPVNVSWRAERSETHNYYIKSLSYSSDYPTNEPLRKLNGPAKQGILIHKL